MGIEYDSKFYDRAVATLESLDSPPDISFIHGNVLDHSLDEATALFMYLVPEGLRRLLPVISAWLQSHPEGRIVTYGFLFFSFFSFFCFFCFISRFFQSSPSRL